MIVGDIIEEGMRALQPELSEQARRERAEALLEAVGLPKESRLRYPHEFSGGQRQRICIARALAVNPRLIVCDEPTSALDVSVQKQIIGLLKQLREQQGLSYLFISHDLAVVAELADQVAVMQKGKIVEFGPVEQILFAPQHEYTKKLLQAVPGRHILQ
jgi:ABC-type microcin C transport system duplicated ATPase subunit YejF